MKEVYEQVAAKNNNNDNNNFFYKALVSFKLFLQVSWFVKCQLEF